MATPRTSLSAGVIIYDILSNDADIQAAVTKVFPVVADEARLPYIAYRRGKMEQTPTKSVVGADTVIIDVLCFGNTYTESIDVAELVRSALDHAQHTVGNLTMRSCVLTDAEELWQDDAYVQSLTFTVRI